MADSPSLLLDVASSCLLPLECSEIRIYFCFYVLFDLTPFLSLFLKGFCSCLLCNSVQIVDNFIESIEELINRSIWKANSRCCHCFLTLHEIKTTTKEPWQSTRRKALQLVHLPTDHT